MTDARIRFATDILRRLGEELNPSPDQSLLELVKNAYDADARSCKVELIDTDHAGGSVRIIDDGDGMEIDAILDGWLVLGRSGKSTRELTRLHRIPAGSKGLGRLAALRMGTVATLETRPRGHEEEYRLRIDWTRFEDAKVVDEVVLPIETERRPRGKGPGTEIQLKNLRSHLGRMDVKRLARAMILLADPFGDDPEGFEPVLAAPEFEDLEKLVSKRYFEDAEYHLHAEVDPQGYAKAEVTDWRGEVLFRTDHEDLSSRRNGRSYDCPRASFDLWAFILNKEAFSLRSSTVEEVRTWLESFGGVHFYHNKLRVAPYGNEGNDWLDMNLRRVRSPEERPSTNTAIGRLSVFDHDERLQQKTDRSGFIEGETFREIRAFAQDAMEWMARRRLRAAEQRRAQQRQKAKERSSGSQRKVENVIATVPKSRQEPLRKAFDAYARSRDREVTQLRKEVQLYRTLSTAGITAATFAHESSGNPIKVITQSIRAIERRSKKVLEENYENLLGKPVESIKKSLDSLAVLGSATLRLVDHGKRRYGRVDLHRVVENVLKTFDPFLSGRDVEVESHLCEGSPFLRGSEAAIESIVTNLLNNSLAAFEVADNARRRRIHIRTEVDEDRWSLRILDSGPGIHGIALGDIWLPGQTTRINGTGLGLTIVRDAVTDLGGTVDAVPESELGGAEIIITLPILGV